MNQPIRVALVDDHVLVRKGLAALLESKNFRVIIQADNGRHFISELEKGEIPDVVLLDINMPVMDGYATAQYLKSNHPEINILALSVLDDEDAIIKMLHAGAGGYLLKDAEPEDLTLAIETIAERGFYHSELVSLKLIQRMQSGGHTKRDDMPVLSAKEKQFLQLICSEMTYKEIASHMQLSPRTIDGYRDMLFEKLGIKSRVGLVLFAIKQKLVNVQ